MFEPFDKNLDLSKKFSHKRILVTGGCGSIGSEIVRSILKFGPEVVRILDNNETELFNLECELGDFNNLRFLVGDVRDRERVSRAIKDIDIVFHAAALKHAPSCEYNPFEAIKTNVIGTQNVLEAAIDENVEKVVNISTDKAANPIGTMGVTKLLTEKLVTASEFYKGNARTIFCSVRFGNVLGSRGSVIPVFKNQLEKCQPLTITDMNMTRFMMSIPQSVELIFKAASMAIGGEVFILKMPAMRIRELAEVMIEEMAIKYKYDGNGVKIKIIGNRGGERVHEFLMNEEESKDALETEDLFILLPKSLILRSDKKYMYEGTRPARFSTYSSDNVKILNKFEIKQMLRQSGIL